MTKTEYNLQIENLRGSMQEIQRILSRENVSYDALAAIAMHLSQANNDAHRLVGKISK